jgi:8-hydroxy-5-deazaflavin:NADPH oxidoreductase
MKVGIIGTGNIGSRVGELLRDAGHDIYWGARRPSGADGVGSMSEAARFGDIVIIAVPYGAWPDLALELSGVLDGKIVVDAGNPDPDRDGRFGVEGLEDPEGSGHPVERLLPNVRLVRTFNVIEAGTLGRQAHRDGEKLGLPIAGDDPEAVAGVSGLVSDAGFEPVIFGNLTSAKKFDRGTPIFGGNMTGRELRAILNKETIA